MRRVALLLLVAIVVSQAGADPLPAGHYQLSATVESVWFSRSVYLDWPLAIDDSGAWHWLPGGLFTKFEGSEAELELLDADGKVVGRTKTIPIFLDSSHFHIGAWFRLPFGARSGTYTARATGPGAGVTVDAFTFHWHSRHRLARLLVLFLAFTALRLVWLRERRVLVLAGAFSAVVLVFADAAPAPSTLVATAVLGEIWIVLLIGAAIWARARLRPVAHVAFVLLALATVVNAETPLASIAAHGFDLLSIAEAGILVGVFVAGCLATFAVLYFRKPDEQAKPAVTGEEAAAPRR